MFQPVFQSEPIASRLWRELRFTVTEVRRDPRRYLRELLQTERQLESRRRLRWGGLVALITYALILTLIIALSFRQAYRQVDEAIAAEQITFLNLENLPQPTVANSGTGGGGGGGNQSELKASQGQPPKASPFKPLVAPNPIPPKITNPSLPVVPTVQVDPSLVAAQLPNVPLGVLTAPPGPPSAGTGEGDGLGDGKGSGVGSDKGSGIGRGGPAGTGGGTGTNSPNSGGGTGELTDVSRVGASVNTRLKVIYKPRPKVTEEALRNKIAGNVVVYVVFRADGTVANARVIQPLGYGLDEEAIKAAYQIKFQPATRNGRPIDTPASVTFPFVLSQ